MGVPATSCVRGAIKHVGSRVTLTDESGRQWCLVGASGLLDGDVISIHGTALYGLSGVRWLVVDPLEEEAHLSAGSQLFSFPDAQAGQSTKREFRRLSVKIRTRIYSGGHSSPVSVSDLSFSGCHVLGHIAAEVGAVLKIDLPPLGMVAARLIWKVEGEGGIAFLVPADVRSCLQG